VGGFGKIFAGLYEGSMLGAGVHVFALWPYCISRSDAKGHVEINPRLAAIVLGCSIPEVEAALEYLQKADPESRSKEEDGRRLVREGQFAYRIVNYAKYRDIRDAESRREYQRDWDRQHRPTRPDKTRHVPTNTTKAEAEAEAEAERERTGDARGAPPPVPPASPSAPPRALKVSRNGNTPGSLEVVAAYWRSAGLSGKPEAFYDHFQANGWRAGGKTPMKDWQAAARNWARNEEKFRPPGNGTRPSPGPRIDVIHVRPEEKERLRLAGEAP
jgi:hypothetical protein